MTTHRNDVDIKKDILAELAWDPQVKETDIGVIVKDGAVTLTGHVPFYSHKTAAAHAAKRIRGVRSLVDKVEVKSSAQMSGSDEDIAEHIARMFEWSSMVNADDIKTEVRNGYVTLTGDLNWQFERDYVQKQVETVKGVKAVFNDINLRKRPIADDIKKKIADALHRQASLESNHVKIAIEGNTVTLSGTVNSYAEHDIIEATTWAAAGVTKVIDNIIVDDVFAVAA